MTRHPSHEILHKLLRFEAESGKLFWRERSPEVFLDSHRTAEGNCQNWNAKYAGQEAFNVESHGYALGYIFGVKYRAHRVIWAMVHGCWPTGDIDHINGDRMDNRVQNLRVVPAVLNARNRPKQSNNKSGVTGVSWDRRRGRWRVQIAQDSRQKQISSHRCITAAIIARMIAEIGHGYTERHGK